MTAPKTYSSARAFRVALETRLQQIAKDEGADLQRLRRQVAFDRLLARLFQKGSERWVLKGGYAMELRMRQARTTKDIDLTVQSPTGATPRRDKSLSRRLREELQAVLEPDLGDFFVFLVGEPMMDLDAAPYGGARYPVDARLDGRTFVKFHLDAGAGDVVLAPLESVEARDWLGFAGVPPPQVSMLSKEQQFSEKLHAYTLPEREPPNSRVKDLVDMVLLIQRGNMDRKRVKDSLAATFGRRKTHDLPEVLSPPPTRWRPVFERLAGECSLSIDIDGAFSFLGDFLAGE